MNFGPRKSLEIAGHAIKMREDGLTWPEICKKLRVHPDWLKNWVDKAGYVRGNKGVLKASPENILRARQLRAEGVSWKMIERKTGISWKTLQWAICVENRKAKSNDL